jgi:hypothetical protein
MRSAARLTGELLARKGQATPTGGFASAAIALSQPLPAPHKRGRAAGEGSRAATGPRSRPGDPQRVALTLRLDREAHRRLRIFAARRGWTGQEVIRKALDAYLAACSVDCACLRDEAGDCVRN